jgi:L-cysteine:1D-myo-inositol 2-amino-2-deoxy-alpha-D-glucopyranoside ligase
MSAAVAMPVRPGGPAGLTLLRRPSPGRRQDNLAGMESWRAAGRPGLPGRGPEPQLADTASGGLAVAAEGHTARMYACGITPYDATHIGHAATYTAWDLLVRALHDAGHDVLYVQNVTDVDDPLLERADRDGVDWRELADAQIVRFRLDMEALRVLPPAHLVGAVEALPLIEAMTRRLAERSSLYELDADLYFARSADRSFGLLSGLGQVEMLRLFGERGGDPGRPGKKDPLDCVVWRGARPGEPAWPSAFGGGRPGWHIECAAIASRFLGVRFDVQAGGSDLVFPHHEMSASHARVASADPDAFARVYAHAGMVRLDGVKMSKSLGNLVFVSVLLAAGADPMAVRLALLANHYRTDWDWTDAGVAAASRRLALWRDAVSAPAAPPAEPMLALVRQRLAADLDAPGALAAVDEWAGAAVRGGPRPGWSGEAPALARDIVDALLGVLL